jgi:hypothetical protein
MNDDALRQLLRSLPPERASAGFTERVLRRLDRSREGRSTSRRLAPPLRLAVAAALLAAVAVGAVAWRAESERQARVAALRAAHRELSAELAGLKRLAASPPVVVVETAPDRHLVLDSDLIAADAAASTRPAAFTY